MPAISNADFLSRWMGCCRAYFGEQTLWEMCLPGSHDTLTYDLGTTVSQSEQAAPILNFLDKIKLLGVGEFIRAQSQTQTLTITEQLNAGMRFLDLRVSWEGPDPSDWHGVHFVITNQKFASYLVELRTWLTQHPTEMVVAWISYHGDPCAPYPGATPAAYAALSASIAEALGNMIVPDGTPWKTSYNQYQAIGRQLVLYVSDTADIRVPGALDACPGKGNPGIDNQTGADVTATGTGFNWELCTFGAPVSGCTGGGTGLYNSNKASGTFTLRSGATSGSEKLIEYQALIHYLGQDTSRCPGSIWLAECRSLFATPPAPATQAQMDCPKDLRALGRMTNFYLQRSMNHTVGGLAGGSLRLPGAMYLDGVLVDGTFDTGTSNDSPTSRYAYVGAMLKSATSYIQGGDSGSGNPLTRQQVDAQIQALLDAAPYDDFSGPEYNRQEDWPPIPSG